MSNQKFSIRIYELLNKFIKYFTYAYLIRFPLFNAIILVVLPFIALGTSARGLLENLFDLSPGSIYLVTLTTMLSALSVMVTSRLALLYSVERFDMSSSPISRLLRWHVILLFSLLAVPMLVGIVRQAFVLREYSTDEKFWFQIVSVIPGILTALLLLWVADRIQRKINGPGTTRVAPDLLMPSTGGGTEAYSRQDGSGPAIISMPGWLSDKMFSLPKNLGAGYIDYGARPVDRFPLLAGHGMAMAMMSVFLLVYIAVGIVTSPWLTELRVPSLAAIVLLVTMLNWMLSGVAFFFDRYRIPVLVVIGVVLIVATIIFGRSDSYYFLEPIGRSEALSSPEKIIRPRDNAKVILVAANGGGIQASAWTARVLTGLEIACRNSPECSEKSFARSVRLISGVSGGSVGTMYFANAYNQDGYLPSDTGQLQAIVDLAGRSSLDGVAWGLVFPDFLRTVFPFFSELPFFWKTDRGRTLEHEWARGLDLSVGLADWRRDVSEGRRPATIFNATIVDSGQPLLFSTIDHTSRHNSTVQFKELYNGYDVPVTTAVRLSATFPYVTPGARADIGGPSTPQYHVVDGGYYDNYGMVALVEWLDDTLEKYQGIADEVLVLRIHSMPTSEKVDPKRGGGLLYQAIVPLLTLSSVRGSGQLSHSLVEFDLLRRRWEGKVNIRQVTFEYTESDAPLSWHLTAKQKKAIEDEWLKQSVTTRQVIEFMSR